MNRIDSFRSIRVSIRTSLFPRNDRKGYTQRCSSSMRNTFSRTIKFHGYVSQHVRGEGTIASHCWREAETINLNKEARPSRVRRSGLRWRGSLISFYRFFLLRTPHRFESHFLCWQWLNYKLIVSTIEVNISMNSCYLKFNLINEIIVRIKC